MVKLKNICFLFFIVLISSTCTTDKRQSLVIQIPINNNWQFWQENDSQKYQANVPGSVHMDLFNNQLIPEPHYSNNEEKLKWIENKNWVYETSFSLLDAQLSKNKIDLVFDGLDTYAKIYLNDIEILKSNNMFLKYSKNVKHLLKNNNILRVEFFSSVQKGEYLYNQHQVQLPADNDRNEKATSVFTRKAPYQYGWDWGPRFVGAGIWKPIYLEFWDDIEIKDDRVHQESLEKGQANLGVYLNIMSEHKEKVHISIFQNDELIQTENLKLNEGENIINKNIVIKNPVLWWPIGSGDSYLYDFKITIQSNSFIWDKNYKIGFRTIELERSTDSIGESFQFIVNGEPIYMKGANYIPQDAFPSRVEEENYRQLLTKVTDANMNMIRVWGGGIYENDEFYEICDSLGILVWQDFMFACSLYPGDTAFLNNVEKEASYQIKRLRDHASLALWCGNNEMNELWHHWGYQKKYDYSKADSTETWHNYLSLFDTLLPQLVQQNNPQTSYLESSPVFGWGTEKSMTHGDSHYWGIWWGKQAFEKYQEKVPRFSSEFGFQSLPHLNTILSYTDSSQLDLFSDDMEAHQKSTIGNKTILEYLPNYYPEPANFEELIYISQLLQAYGMDLAFKAQRFAKPCCMGTLYWQLNDCWPGLSWSSLDYYQQKKATHYVAKKDFATFLLQSNIEDEKLAVKIVSDSLQEIQAHLSTIIISFIGDTLYSKDTEVVLKANQVKTITLDDIVNKDINPKHCFIQSQLSIGGKELAKSIDLLVKPKELQLQKSKLNITAIGKNQFSVRSSTSTFNYKVYLSTSEFGNFEPNFFHLLPGDSIVVEFIPNDIGKVISMEEIEVFTLNNILPIQK